MDTRKIRAQLTRKQGNRCFYCRKRMGPAGSGQIREATLDHVVPRAEGGTSHRSNLVAACRVCNEAKITLSAAEFREVLETATRAAELEGR